MSMGVASMARLSPCVWLCPSTRAALHRKQVGPPRYYDHGNHEHYVEQPTLENIRVRFPSSVLSYSTFNELPLPHMEWAAFDVTYRMLPGGWYH